MSQDLPKPRQVTCCRCGDTFEPEWSEAEARAEYEANFPDIPWEDRGDPLCDKCHDEFWKWAKGAASELNRKAK